MKANVPTRKKVKLNWFKTRCEFKIERKIEIQYTSENISSNKLKWDAIVKYVLFREGDFLNKDIPANSPMTLYKNNMPFLFLNTAESSGTKVNSENLIDDDIKVEDDIVNVIEGEPKINYEDAVDPKEHIEVRTRYDKISRKITIENKLDNNIELIFDFKQTKEVTFIKSDPNPSLIEEPNYKYNLTIPAEEKVSIILELQAKIVSRITKIKPEFLKPPKK
jgi:hypothetical protein